MVMAANTFPSSFVKLSSTSPRFCNSVSKRIFSDVAGDITIFVDGQSFLLHKFPLVSRSGKIRKMVVDSRDPDLSKLEFFNVPGGFFAFELAVKFCYGMNFEIQTSNVANLRCIGEYLEMTEDYREGNLIAQTETYMTDIVLQSIEKSIEVLCACSSLLPIAEEVGIINRCIDAIAATASKEQLACGLARLECNGGSGKLDMDCQDWWVEDLSALNINHYQRVIAAMRRAGVRSDSITASLIHYAHTCLKGIERRQAWDSNLSFGDEQRVIVEALVGLLSTEKIKSVPLAFLFGMLRIAIEVNASVSCRLELERIIGFRLEVASLDDLLIPSLQKNDSVFDVDTVHRILANFMQRIEEEDSDESSQCGYESEGLNSPSHSSVLKVGRLIDGYLAEIAPDPYLKLQKFMAIIELLPDYARVIEDGLYRAIDIYLKAHPSLTESECQKLCKHIDCQKLSQEASNHAAQNDRLPVQMTVRVLYFEQLRLKSALSSSSADADGSFSQRIMGSSGVPSAAVSPRDNYASLRRENRELKLEISRMRVRLSELEKEHAVMKDGIRESKSGEHGRAFLSSLSKGIGKIGFFVPGNGKQHKNARKAQATTDGKPHRRQLRRSSIA
ncbi:putative BTB/POZ domain-containing protein At3g08660 [Dendrobium catenatum]|uniref:BTB/POZ domain-containing protein n=1 Tax=Dendrobium catenatum TaxID=906689 RepID=A0A2I0XDN9_9ASPA|nr:putative BTB/POZ domain-containing protein At3g08660 [Dendrobium catenatum]PKU86026.1 BTB/POZ domain-containing protein [Dendrobium catenatum]